MHTNSQSTGNGDEATNSGAYDMITFDEIRIKDVVFNGFYQFFTNASSYIKCCQQILYL